MRIPQVNTYWLDRAAETITACSFQMFVTKMDDIQEEFGGSPRKQTKAETLTEGFKFAHNAQAAKSLVGKRFMISRSGKPLHITALPTNVLKALKLPDEYEEELGNGKAKKTKDEPVESGAFAAFGKIPTNSTKSAFSDNESRRIAMAAKRMFIELGASLEVIYAHTDNDLLLVEVKESAVPESMVEAVFEGGEHSEGLDNYNISFGLIKDIV